MRSTDAVLDDDIESRRSARIRHRPTLVSSDTTSSDLARPSSIHTAGAKDRPNGVAKTNAGRIRRIKPPAAGLSGSGRAALVATTHGVKVKRSRDARKPANDAATHKRRRASSRPPQPPLSATQELVRRARAAAAAATGTHSAARGGRDSIMDVVLGAQAPNTRLHVEDLQDAIEECYRAALAVPTCGADAALADMFVPGRYAARQAAPADAVLAAPEEFTPNEIYRVSAERSTVAWEPELDSDDSASMESCAWH